MKAIKIVTLSLLALVVVLGGGFYVTQKAEQDYMLEVARSEEATEVYMKNLINLDKNALTDKGKIKEYYIDDSSIESNPMGGIMVTLIINNDTQLYVKVGLMYDDNTHKLRSPSTSYSRKLDELVKE